MRQSKSHHLFLTAQNSGTTRLSQVIAERWRRLPEHGRNFYRQVARADHEHYNECMLVQKVDALPKDAAP
jgi:hypothetical protein